MESGGDSLVKKSACRNQSKPAVYPDIRPMKNSRQLKAVVFGHETDFDVARGSVCMAYSLPLRHGAPGTS